MATELYEQSTLELINLLGELEERLQLNDADKLVYCYGCDNIANARGTYVPGILGHFTGPYKCQKFVNVAEGHAMYICESKNVRHLTPRNFDSIKELGPEKVLSLIDDLIMNRYDLNFKTGEYRRAGCQEHIDRVEECVLPWYNLSGSEKLVQIESLMVKRDMASKVRQELRELEQLIEI